MKNIEDKKQNITDQNSQANFNQPMVYEEEIPFREAFKDYAKRMRPYILRLWEARKKFFYINGGIAVLSVLYLLFLAKPYFDSTVTILPDYGNKSSAMLSQLSGLASLAGVNVGETAPTEIYENLIISEAVLEPVIYFKYKTEEFDSLVNLIQYFEIEADESLPDSLQGREMFLSLLEDLTEEGIKTGIERMTKILTITVRMPEGQLSADVANNIIKFLNNYVIKEQKSYATEQREYLDKRLTEVKDSLGIAENNLKNFREQNRLVINSPQLLLEQARLSRAVQIKQTVYIELMKQYELVKLEEVKDTPVINLKEYAKNPIEKTGPSRLIRLILIMFFSGVISGFIFMFMPNLKEYWEVVRGE